MYKINGKEFDTVCCLYSTAALANSVDIREGYELLKEADVVFPVTEYSFPPMRSLRVNETGFAEFRYPEHMSTRSQDLEPWFHDAGQWYWYYTTKLNNSEQNLISRIIKLTNLMVQDIDTINDWKLAEIKYKNIKNA
jgi:pseudaminic acid cytidylyltransferase